MTRLHLHSFGDGLTSVLLLHGLGSAGPVWWRIAEGLDEAGYGCLAPDLRGHGESPLANVYAFDAYAQDVVASCPGSWDLVIGHSLGGAVAVRAGATDPEFAKRFLLVDPAIDLDAATIAQLRGDLVAEAEDPPSVNQLVADHPRWTREDCVLKHTAVLATSPEVMAATFDDNPVWHLSGEMAALSAPVHLLGAATEPLYTPADFEKHHSGSNGLSFEVVPDTGHSIYRDDPKTVIAAALSLLSS